MNIFARMPRCVGSICCQLRAEAEAGPWLSGGCCGTWWPWPHPGHPGCSGCSQISVSAHPAPQGTFCTGTPMGCHRSSRRFPTRHVMRWQRCGDAAPRSASPWIYCVTLGWYLRSEVPQNLYCSYQVSEGQEDVGMVSFCCRSSADPLVFVSSETRSAGIYFPKVGSTLVWILGGGDWGKEGETFPSAMTQCL